jgi:hypothetical protein
MNCFYLSDEQFMRSRHAAFHNAALEADRAISKYRCIYILRIFPLEIKCRKFIFVSARLGTEISILLLEGFPWQIDDEASALLDNMV